MGGLASGAAVDRHLPLVVGVERNAVHLRVLESELQGTTNTSEDDRGQEKRADRKVKNENLHRPSF